MTELQKAPTGPPDLALYALAEARFEDLEKLPACGRCKDCPGPEVKGSRCFDWQPEAPALKRRDWQFCPQGYTKVLTWRRVVERVVAAKVSPLGDWSEYTAGMYDAAVHLHVALRKEEDRRIEERRQPQRSQGGSGTPFRARMTGGRR